MGTTNDYLAAIQQTLYCEWTQNGDLVSVGDIASVIDCLHSKKPERQKEGRPLIQLNNIFEDGILDMSETFFISEEDYEKWISRCEIQPGDCVITNVGRIGAVSQAPRGTKAAMGRNMTCIRPRAYQSTLITALCSGAMRLEIKRRTDSGTIMNALNVRNIPKLELMVPQKSKRDQLEAQLRSIQDQREVLKEECRCLGYLRDVLLPKLMSGEIDVSKVELPMQPNNHLAAVSKLNCSIWQNCDLVVLPMQKKTHGQAIFTCPCCHHVLKSLLAQDNNILLSRVGKL